jgi:hypothetical protein
VWILVIQDIRNKKRHSILVDLETEEMSGLRSNLGHIRGSSAVTDSRNGKPRWKTGAKIMEIETRIQGIPCIVKLVSYERVNGSFSRNAASDLDYYGWSDATYQVCDRRGRPAPWLERKATDKDWINIDIQMDRVREYQND